MISFPIEEEIDVRDIILPGCYWRGMIEIKTGEIFPISHIERGKKQKPCRLNSIHIPTSEFGLAFIEVPEDSYVTE
jgi:hypothetical protein